MVLQWGLAKPHKSSPLPQESLLALCVVCLLQAGLRSVEFPRFEVDAVSDRGSGLPEPSLATGPFGLVFRAAPPRSHLSSSKCRSNRGPRTERAPAGANSRHSSNDADWVSSLAECR
jgi:hypothetical protein